MLGRRSSRIHAKASQSIRCNEIEMLYDEIKPPIQRTALHWEIKVSNSEMMDLIERKVLGRQRFVSTSNLLSVEQSSFVCSYFVPLISKEILI